MTVEERLLEYINEDLIYTLYKQNKLFNPSDFDKFCIEHCKDIETILNENTELKQRIKRMIKVIDDQLLNGELITYEDFRNKIKGIEKS